MSILDSSSQVKFKSEQVKSSWHLICPKLGSWTGQVKSGQVKSSRDRSSQVATGKVRTGQVRKGQEKTGQVKSEHVKTSMDKSIDNV